MSKTLKLKKSTAKLLTKCPNNREVRTFISKHVNTSKAKFARCKNTTFAINESGIDNTVHKSINAAKRTSRMLSKKHGAGINVNI